MQFFKKLKKSENNLVNKHQISNIFGSENGSVEVNKQVSKKCEVIVRTQAFQLWVIMRRVRRRKGFCTNSRYKVKMGTHFGKRGRNTE